MNSGLRKVEDPVYCSLTRFGLRSPMHAMLFRRTFNRVVADARTNRVPGLMHSALLFERKDVCFSLSFWDREPLMSAHLAAHVDAANNVFSWLRDHKRDHESVGPELWSTQWRLDAVSNNLFWSGFDLRPVIRTNRDDLIRHL